MEKFTIGYKTLFSVQVLHRYFLNHGSTAFDAAPLDEQKTVKLIRNQYDISRFWHIKPDRVTYQTLKNQRMVFKNLLDGFMIAVETGGTNSPFIPFPTELRLVFEIYPTDPFFMLYTDIDKTVMDTLMKKIDETIDGKTMRVSKVFRLKNTGSTSQSLNSSEDIPLSSIETYQNTEGGREQPLGYIEIRHAPSTVALLNGGNVQTNLVFTIPLRNRSTIWEFEATGLGTHPLVANGRIPVLASGKQLSNPTPSTTSYKSGNFVSIIY
jgi:hypothetical protein